MLREHPTDGKNITEERTSSWLLHNVTLQILTTLILVRLLYMPTINALFEIRNNIDVDFECCF